MAPISSYRTAKTMIRLSSDISFLRTCKTLKVIPKGLRAKNVLKYTCNSPAADKMSQKHRRKWLRLAIDSQYHRLAKIRRFAFPLNNVEDKQITNHRISLRKAKRANSKNSLAIKMQQTENHQVSRTYPPEH